MDRVIPKHVLPANKSNSQNLKITTNRNRCTARVYLGPVLCLRYDIDVVHLVKEEKVQLIPEADDATCLVSASNMESAINHMKISLNEI